MRHNTLSWVFFQRSEIPELTGYSPKRHHNCADLSVLKKAQVFNIEKQRTIGILETEFNHSNRTLGREVIHIALQLNAIATEQFSRPGRSSIGQSTLKRLTMDHQMYKRQCFAQTSIDLSNNYDRIVHTAVALACLRLGISHNKIKAMFKTIQTMIHRVRTTHGDSSGTYGGEDIGDWENYPQGILQGNACGPTIWAILSSVIF